MTLTAPTDAMLETICDMAWNHDKTNRDGTIHIWDTYEHDVCNHTHSGTVEHEGIVYGFIIDNGNNDGAVVRKWGLEEDIPTYKPPAPTLFTMIPDHHAISVKADATAEEFEQAVERMMVIYSAWRKMEWFRDWERSYNYDRHFQPGNMTEVHYRHKPVAGRGQTLEQMKMRVGTLDQLSPMELKYLKT